MATAAPGYDYSAILTAARHWIDQCLIDDGSMFTTSAIWTSENLDELQEHFVLQPNAGEGTFLEKLVIQLAPASPAAIMLMAELHWALQLFPSNTLSQTKVRHFHFIAGRSDIPRSGGDRWLEFEVLRGIGSAGAGYGAYFWREVAYAIAVFRQIKAMPREDRMALLENYEALTPWLESLMNAKEDRQYRHMLRFFAFPDRVERMSSNRNRRDVLAAFDGIPEQETYGWTDLQLDSTLLGLRKRLEHELGIDVLDFYESPLRERWMEAAGQDATAKDPDHGRGDDNPPPAEFQLPTAPTNIIFYGPPGTGKTRKIEHLRTLYSDTLATVNREAWLDELVSAYTWLPVFVAALASIGGPARATDIAASEISLAKARPSSSRSHTVTPPVASYLYEHALEAHSIPPSMRRRNPLVFDRIGESEWQLSPEWREVVPEAALLLDHWHRGPTAGTSAVQRYRMVTFHPSYGYEDFVQGIRPTEDEEGKVSFRTVDGAFKKLCDQAAGNPTQRYAIFIDEINRANVSKVFGELISLIEVDKRIGPTADTGNGLRVNLAGSDEAFGVPANVDIYGTMNTSDRSIALMDIALRRRFQFLEMPPDYGVLSEQVGGVDLARLLSKINDRLEYLIDRDHRIGHAYLKNVDGIPALVRAFETQIIPLLEEYFFDRKEKVSAVLSDRLGSCAFFSSSVTSASELFAPEIIRDMQSHVDRYVMTNPISWTSEHFIAIYE